MLMLERDESEKIVGHDERRVRMRLKSPILHPYLSPSQRKSSPKSGDGTREEEVGLDQGWKMTQ
jgi:hypothetical protein